MRRIRTGELGLFPAPKSTQRNERCWPWARLTYSVNSTRHVAYQDFRLGLWISSSLHYTLHLDTIISVFSVPSTGRLPGPVTLCRNYGAASALTSHTLNDKALLQAASGLRVATVSTKVPLLSSATANTGIQTSKCYCLGRVHVHVKL